MIKDFIGPAKNLLPSANNCTSVIRLAGYVIREHFLVSKALSRPMFFLALQECSTMGKILPL